MSDESVILNSAVEHFGQPAQVLKCIEECAELICELEKHLFCDKDDIITNTILSNINEFTVYIKKACKEYIPEINPQLYLFEVDVNESVISELADVDIMSAQMKIIFGDCSKERKFKLDRLKERINNANR